MKITIEYAPTHENMDYAEWLEIDIVQKLSMADSLDLIEERTAELVLGSEGVFNIKADDEIIFNKQELGRLPNGQEIVDYIINNS
tara:strand:- start:1263 stop:1517 length:255 start_codon:yes stop_codon:yes gene_type:complete